MDYTAEDELIIKEKWDDLLFSCTKICKNDEDWNLIKRAFFLAKEAHQGVRRRSGEPYLLHPIAVAKIVIEEIGLGVKSVVASLLHDVVEDTEYTVEDMERIFGPKIASMVDGLTKMSGVFNADTSKQAEYFRKVLLTLSDDVRVILIKIADRLHNMRTLGSMPLNKQIKITSETIYLFAPLAYRLGLYSIKSELEDLCMKYRFPQEYAEITRKLSESEASRQEFVDKFNAPIIAALNRDKINYEISARVKSVYSIWNKMQRKQIPFEEVYDLFAIRIVFKPLPFPSEKTQCWQIYSSITDTYTPKPDRLRDWISMPKANGYEALHSTVMGPDGVWVEVQIRTQRMEEIAERGFAAHWKYKVGNSDEESELDIWLKTIKDILEHPEPNAIDFLDTIKLNLFSTEIFVFTPKGELITLPKDATALDLAFTLHSDLGFHCIAAKVNHRLVPLNQKLHSGDQVEILTSKSQTPKEEWLNFITTAKARSRLTASLRKDRRKIIAKGEKILKDFFESNHIEYNNDVVTKILSNLGIRHRDDLFYKIGNDEITPNENIKKIIKGKSQNPFMRYLKLSFGSNNGKNEQPKPVTPQQLTIDRKQTYILRDENGVKNYKVADCCCPIPGDDVLGYVEDDETVVVHKRECPVAMRLKSSFGPRLVSTQWEASESLSFPAKIEIQGIDRIGILNEITRVISNELIIDMRGLTIKANEGVFTGTVNIMVHDTRVVESLCNKLRKIKGVQKVARCKE